MANMGAEVGATTSTFPYTPNMQAYLHATGRGPVARAADEAASKGFLSADEGAEYDEVIEIVSIFSVVTKSTPYIPRRTCPISSLLSTAHSHPTWRLLCLNLGPSFKSKDGKTRSLLDSLDRVPTAHMKTWSDKVFFLHMEDLEGIACRHVLQTSLGKQRLLV